MNLYEKLLDIQKSVDTIIKDGRNQSDKYDFASDENVLDTFRPLMDERKLLLIPRMKSASIHEGTTRSGTVRYLTEITFDMVWHDTESGEELSVPWYSQGVDLAGEKGVGKAATYAEKYFLLKFFHIPTKRDDPDGDERTKRGELKTRGTAAAKENADYYRRAIFRMLSELYGGDGEKIKAGLTAVTKSPGRGYAGCGDVNSLTAAALPVVYAKIKKTYETRTGKVFSFEEDDNAAD